MKKIITDAIIISKINILSLRESLTAFVIISLFIPLGMTYLISLASPNWDLITKVNYLTGMLVLSSSLTIINGIGQFIGQDRLGGIISWYRTSPVHPLSYILGVTSTYLISILIECIILIPIASILWRIPFNIINIGIITLVVIVQSLALIGIGAVIGTRAKNIQTVSALTNVLSFVIAFATPAYYSISAVPEKFRLICYILPTTEASLFIKNLYLHGVVDVPLLIILILISIPYLLIGFIGIKWREK
ncbi:MAG: ABC transporter permease [Thermoplasmata archaeon]|nr:ABC transporter permease [Thermoplasmata archaeon]